ncbi:hypothetical protein BASA81_000751 [Batrachochytrium salamandrivorans]|nr:hypothetical protein BASA81_000751 [Batrachochytrium salamandrivorans]
MRSFFLLLLAAARPGLASCPAFAKGWYSNGSVHHAGVPPATSTFTFSPSFLTCQEVQELNSYCVSQINRFRAGKLKTSTGWKYPGLQSLPALKEAADVARCQAEITLGDLKLMDPSCGAGAHVNAFACEGTMDGYMAQNSCCPRDVTPPTLLGAKAVLDECLLQMWDEGMGLAQKIGHFLVMSSPKYAYAACGTAFATGVKDGKPYLLLTQNFAGLYWGRIGTWRPTQKPTTRFPTRKPTREPTRKPVCGNGVVEASEQCDCGLDCAQDKCCNAKTCRYQKQAVCSRQDGCCDPATCQLRKKGYVCRPSRDGCDPNETCTGTSKRCPKDVDVKVGEACANNAGLCTPCRKCVPSLHAQCQTRSPKWYQACEWMPPSELCQQLWCNVKSTPTSTCMGTLSTLAGSKCGPNQSCYLGKCVDNSNVACPE